MLRAMPRQRLATGVAPTTRIVAPATKGSTYTSTAPSDATSSHHDVLGGRIRLYHERQSCQARRAESTPDGRVGRAATRRCCLTISARPGTADESSMRPVREHDIARSPSGRHRARAAHDRPTTNGCLSRRKIAIRSRSPPVAPWSPTQSKPRALHSGFLLSGFAVARSVRFVRRSSACRARRQTAGGCCRTPSRSPSSPLRRARVRRRRQPTARQRLTAPLQERRAVAHRRTSALAVRSTALPKPPPDILMSM